jgi:hypothetical protein
MLSMLWPHVTGSKSCSFSKGFINTLTSAALRGPRAQVPKAAVRPKGSKNFGNDELNSLLELIEKMLPTGSEFWDLVCELHRERYENMNRNAVSIKKKFYKLANEKPGTGNPTISAITLKAKQIKEAINVKAGVTDADVSEFFDEYPRDDDIDEGNFFSSLLLTFLLLLLT